MGHGEAYGDEHHKQHGERNDARRLVGPLGHLPRQIHVQGHLAGHGGIAHDAHGQRNEDYGHVQQIPSKGERLREGLVADKSRAAAPLGHPALSLFVALHLRAEIQHEGVAAHAQDEGGHDQRRDEGVLGIERKGCRARNRCRRRKRQHDRKIGAFQAAQIRIARRIVGHRDGKALALRHEVGRERHEHAHEGNDEGQKPEKRNYGRRHAHWGTTASLAAAAAPATDDVPAPAAATDDPPAAFFFRVGRGAGSASSITP